MESAQAVWISIIGQVGMLRGSRLQSWQCWAHRTLGSCGTFSCSLKEESHLKLALCQVLRAHLPFTPTFDSFHSCAFSGLIIVSLSLSSSVSVLSPRGGCFCYTSLFHLHFSHSFVLCVRGGCKLISTAIISQPRCFPSYAACTPILFLWKVCLSCRLYMHI